MLAHISHRTAVCLLDGQLPAFRLAVKLLQAHVGLKGVPVRR